MKTKFSKDNKVIISKIDYRGYKADVYCDDNGQCYVFQCTSPTGEIYESSCGAFNTDFESEIKDYIDGFFVKNIKFVASQIVFQEVPDEISLMYTLSGCVHDCKNCHSPELRDEIGTDLEQWESNKYTYIENDLEKPSNKFITCVLFEGGDDKDHIDSLKRCARYVHKKGLKVALYSGCTLETIDKQVYNFVDYLKVGPYIEEKGPINNPNTNQRMYTIKDKKIDEDITSKFWRKNQ